MTRWEYRLLDDNNWGGYRLMDELKEAGKDGWEVVWERKSDRGPRMYEYLLKRPIQEQSIFRKVLNKLRRRTTGGQE